MTDINDKPDTPQGQGQDKSKPQSPSANKQPQSASQPSTNKNKSLLRSRKKHSKNTTADKKSVGQYVREKRRARFLLLLSILSLTVALTASYGVYWLWQQGLEESSRLEQQDDHLSNNLNQLQDKTSRAELNNESQRLAIKQQLSDEFTSLIDGLRQKESPAVEPNWLLSETEYLILIADHRLQLVGDVDTAIAALMLADERLYSLGDPRVLNARRQLKNDINLLRTLPRIDTVGIALSLSSLQQSITDLPLNQLSSQKSAGQKIKESLQNDTQSWTGFLSSVTSTIKELVSVRRVSDNTVAVVPPEQSGFLVQNLALKLETARHALLTKDEALFHQSLRFVSDWLARYFDNQDSAVQSMQSTLQQMSKIKLVQELPNIGASLQAVKAIQLQRQVPAVPDEAPVSETPKKMDGSTADSQPDNQPSNASDNQ